ncbi:hypothetical protein LZQ00_00700 [Sphingobacterium sp. SRCM116780]|uniref:hypothetical protein n=1 Tax=Sphingobacterium sp. SRCM116780 TaxID=2907623 RepID=UPI001F2C7A1C|nr:hypothetical protein [Sphingobacterium sp. SRCM116780]UIR56361.1 hypothetical protein LZQ00_00700 [Sphingobacterium sp. SRCM116780]
MTKVINYHAYHAAYGNIANCLDSIYQLERAGKFEMHPALLQQFRLLESDVLKKLYTHAIYLYAELAKVAPESSPLPDEYFHGDFDEEDFLFDDFYAGYLDFDSTSYNVIFRTILLILNEIKQRGYTLNEEQLRLLDADLVVFLSVFWKIQAAIKKLGIQVCMDLEANAFHNSDGVMVQAAGSDGQQGVVQGVHLRWSFSDELGHNHLPKGDYFNGKSVTLNGYNQTDDFVHIYRTPYSQENKLFVDFLIHRPVILAADRTWIYTINETQGTQLRTSHVRIVFEDQEAYDQLLGPFDPSEDPQGFINQYDGVLSIDVHGKSYFQIGLSLSNGTDAGQHVKLEGISGLVPNNSMDADDHTAYATEILAAEHSRMVTFMADNLKYVRVKKAQELFLKGVQIETYEGLLVNKQAADWMEVGNGFGLSLNDAVVLDRLENASKRIDNLWPHFNEGTKLRAANYVDKWQSGDADDPALKDLVRKYLTLSETDFRAIEELERDASVAEMETIRISNLDVINLIALDYHFARMLGLGHIDQDAATDSGEKYVYQLRYSNRSSLVSTEETVYQYTSIPTSIHDERLPEKPAIRPVSYTFPNNMGTLNNMLDAKGYNKTARMRVINIGREKYHSEEKELQFFDDLTTEMNHNESLQSKAVYYGVEYRNGSDSSYVKPEITHAMEIGGKIYYDYDPAYPEGVMETVPVIDNDESLYTHFVTENGEHVYAIYGINWFGRASVISDEVSSDETVFPAINKLQAPGNVTVQYLQEEDPIIFTTQTEQNWLTGRKQAFPNQDTGMTRVTFDWLDMMDISDLSSHSPERLAEVVRADQVEGLFLDRMPLQLVGKLLSVEEIVGESELVRLKTGPHILIDGSQLAPIIPETDHFRFQDSVLTTSDGNFRVKAVEAGQSGVDIILYKRRVGNIVSDEDEVPSYGIATRWQLPKSGDKFTTIENLGQHANWSPIQAAIPLVDFADVNQPTIETRVDIEGNKTHLWVGGITDEATVTPLFGAHLQANEQLPGYYEVRLPNYVLPAHPQTNIPYLADQPNRNAPNTVNPAHVEWYKGIIRMPLADLSGESIKELQVVRIESLNPLLLYVADPTYVEKPIQVPATVTELVTVNFHPGYRAYFFNEPLSGQLNKTHIEPTAGENDRKTLLTLYSKDRIQEGFTSGIATPTVLFALRHDEPQDIEQPVALGEGNETMGRRAFAGRAVDGPLEVKKVRPDSTKSAAFTFDITVGSDANGSLRNPFGYVFYRTDQQEILEALYKPETIVAIQQQLSGLTEDPYYYQRFYELANQVFDAANPTQYNVFEAQPQAYGFPIPDQTGLDLATDALEIKKLKYIGAIQSALMPITEQPVIFTYVKEGQVTENAIPAIRDIDGKLMDPNDSKFNPFPMVRKFQDAQLPNSWFLRFTDYNLNGNSNNLYFYAAVEVNAKLQPGNLSPFAGPVTVLSTVASEAPKIKSYVLQSNENMEWLSPLVSFTLDAFLKEDQVTKIRLYRFASMEQARSLSGSEATIDAIIDNPADLTHTLIDTFSDKSEFPYGSTYYYRFVGVRTLVNEGGALEEVLTAPSEIIEMLIPDTRKTAGAVLTYMENPSQLTWEPIGKDYAYYLFQMNNNGNWVKVAEQHAPDTNQTMHYAINTTEYPRLDADGDALYYRFKLSVTNTLGEYSLQESELTI